MDIRKTIATVTVATFILSFTACANNETPKENSSGVGDTQTNSNSIPFIGDGNAGVEEISALEPVKETGIWDVLPEIPVTDASAFEYRYDSKLGGMVITDYLRESPKVRIPDTLEGEPVVGIKLYTTSKHYTINELIFPDTIKEINLYSVLGLQYMNFPSVFSLKLDPMFYHPKPTVAYIGEKVKKIGNTFQNCEKLTTISIPNNVTAISACAFDGCPNLTEVYYKGKKYDGLTKELIDTINSNSNGGFIVEDGFLKECYGSGDLVIPDGVTRIKSSTDFLNRTSISSIILPNSVIEIGSEAFKDCTSLTSVIIPDSVTIIYSEAFSGCTSLTNVTIPDSVIKIGGGAFQDCTSLTNVTYKGKTYDYEHIYDLYEDINCS